MDEILSLLKNDAKLTPKDIALMLGREEQDIVNSIKQLEEDNIILGYKTIVNPEKENSDAVSAFIEVRINPEKKTGFDSIAKKLYQYSQVRSLYLMSGGYDFLIEVEGNDLKEVAYFISERLATIGKVQHTSTHFLLKKYKENGIILDDDTENNRLAVSA
jgi:DNA-binding Lrp family transcriptional regulator